jgi:HK97 family phage major capsid protein
VNIAGASFSNGSPVVTTGADGTRRILSMPVALTEYTPALGSAGDVLLVDLSQYAVAERSRDFLSSLHVRFIWDEQVFRSRYRVDGQPLWQQPVTPKNSTTTQSPFIRLAERT